MSYTHDECDTIRANLACPRAAYLAGSERCTVIINGGAMLTPQGKVFLAILVGLIGLLLLSLIHSAWERGNDKEAVKAALSPRSVIQDATEQQQREQREAEIKRLQTQSLAESQWQMLRNFHGEAHDTFLCKTSDPPVVTFDYGHYWWPDDGRCAAQQTESASNIHTTLRVDTDIDSSWLQNEMRTCRTYPDVNGRVARVVCNASGSHQQHNIPITFWGRVDRNVVSDWKCTRESVRETGLSERLDTWLSGYSAEFVCRAID